MLSWRLQFRTAVLWAVAALFMCVRTVQAWNGPPSIGARAAALMDVTTGEVLYEKNGHVRLPMASTTKIMTGVVALERGDMDEIVKVDPLAARTEGSALYIRAGEEYPLRDLVAGLLLRSGNDAAVAIAQSLAGGVEDFAAWMNEKARQLGATNTNFQNPHGLPANGHYTTAVDLARIASYAMHVPGFAEIVSSRTAMITWPGHDSLRTIVNRNKLLWEYEGATGIKTGYTRAAGRCFVGSAMRGGRQLVAVVLNSPAIWEETMALLDYGFGKFRLLTAVSKGEIVGEAKVNGGVEEVVKCIAVSDLPVVVPSYLAGKVTRRIEYRKQLGAPVLPNQVVGSVTILVDGKEKGKVDVVAQNAVPRRTIWYSLQEWLRGKGLN